ncbi:MAG: hypothetical protein LBG80_06115 [Bacteroidales bacterium]|jgi:hypothetical protein|nr:hypothetical protein [Bacteroidales bacterium]
MNFRKKTNQQIFFDRIFLMAIRNSLSVPDKIEKGGSEHKQMKKIILGLLALVIIGSAVFFACKKESDVIEKQDILVIKQQKAPVPGDGANGFCVWWTDKKGDKHAAYAEWEGKGHVAREDRDHKFDADVKCFGSGLCKFKAGITSVAIDLNENNFSLIYLNDKGNYFIEVSVNENILREEFFEIEEEEKYIDDFGNTFKISQGKYPFDETIGKQGGYILPIEVQIENFQ